MWQGRFRKDPSNRLREFGESVSFDQRLFRQDITASIAHARALLKAGILRKEEFASIENGLREIEQEILADKFEFSVELEDVHMNIEAELTRRIGPTGAKLHTARSRNDQVATDLRLYLREECAAILQAITQLQVALVDLATTHRHIRIPGYTHLQRAQPVPLAHHLLAYVEMLARDAGRVGDAAGRMNYCPLGSGALAGSTIALDREAVAMELGFAGVTRNSMDAVGDRDFVCELLAALAILGMHLSRLSEDVILWASSEFGFLRLSDAHTTGSSLMPQKKNPDAAELTRGKTGRLYGNLMAILTICKGLPMTYNRDLQEDKEPVFDSIDTVRASLEMFAEMMAEARFDSKAAARAVADPLLLATDLADALVNEGVPFRQAHEKVGRLVAAAEESGVSLSALKVETIKQIAPEIADCFQSFFDLESALAARSTTGSPAPLRVDEQLAWWRQELAKEGEPQ